MLCGMISYFFFKSIFYFFFSLIIKIIPFFCCVVYLMRFCVKYFRFNHNLKSPEHLVAFISRCLKTLHPLPLENQIFIRVFFCKSFKSCSLFFFFNLKIKIPVKTIIFFYLFIYLKRQQVK